ncbi:MAG: glycosyltransferase [Gemmatimonadaceae bacterium]|nr:glycosyltransferase [Gemmatimonadaceae bacterium]
MSMAAQQEALASAAPLDLSVVIALYNRLESVKTVLSQLARQSLASERFEVIVVDDGSSAPAPSLIDAASYPFALTLHRQTNAGPAAARDRGIRAARGHLVVVLDDDMRVAEDFLASHLAAHADARGPRVVLGRLLAPANGAPSLIDRYLIAQLERLARDVAHDPALLRGGHVYTGNVSFPRALYAQVGGFDRSLRLSEDAELGIRFELAGAEFRFSESASSEHLSDHADLNQWIARSVEYGVVDSRIAEKHRGLSSANPWRFAFLVHPVSRVLIALTCLAPAWGHRLARAVLRGAHALAALGAERPALVATTLAYGLLYFVGVRTAAGSSAQAFADLRHYLSSEQPERLERFGLIAKCVADMHADHAMLHATDARYRPDAVVRGFTGDAVQRIGLQILVAYRFMRLCRQLGFGLFARIVSRLMRHLYSADIHWNAELAPGIVIVHGVGLVISHTSRVAEGCVLFQHVTLGESIHPVTREIGSPALEPHVHVAPGAVLVGPIVVGRESKVAANAVVTVSVPARSVVESPHANIRSRDSGVSI